MYVNTAEAPLTKHPEPTNTDALRSELLATVDLLKNRRADLISEALVAEYVARYWMEWNGGSLQLTETGKNVVQQMRAAARTPAV
jgi:hypothetical protein